MSTFCAVNDELLASMIREAQRRIVYIAPGLFQPVAKALCNRFDELDRLDVTLVLDASEDVCRIGFGEIEALKLAHQMTERAGFYVRSQPGLRVGVLLVDEKTLVWSPTPRAVEAPPDAAGSVADSEAVDAGKPAPASQAPTIAMPNGLMLGSNPSAQIAEAVCADGTETAPADAEIGRAAVTPTQVAEVTAALVTNPPIPVDLARVTRVFSTKLQFVEMKVKGAKLAQKQIRVSSDLLNADANDQLRSLLEGRLRAFADFKDREVAVPMFVRGEQVFDRDQKPILEPVSEASLNRERSAIEADFLYDVAGFGRLMERARRAEFERRVEAYKTRLVAHSEGMRKTVGQEAEVIIRDTVNLIGERIARAGSAAIDREKLVENLRKTLTRVEDEAPTVAWVFKEVTYEQTQDEGFRIKLDKALPPAVKRRLGNWYEKFNAAKQDDAASKDPAP